MHCTLILTLLFCKRLQEKHRGLPTSSSRQGWFDFILTVDLRVCGRAYSKHGVEISTAERFKM